MDGWSCVIIIEVDKFTSLLWVSWVVVLAGFGVLDSTPFWFFFTLFLAPHPSITYSCFPFSSPLLSLHSSSYSSIHLYTCRNNLPASHWRCLDGQQLSISRHAESDCCGLRTRISKGSLLSKCFDSLADHTARPRLQLHSMFNLCHLCLRLMIVVESQDSYRWARVYFSRDGLPSKHNS